MESYMGGIYEQQMARCVPRTEGPLDTVIERCLRPRLSERYESFQELREALERIFEQKTGRRIEISEPEEETTALWNTKGASLDALGRHAEAIHCYDKALSIDPGAGIVWSNKGVSLDALARHAEAIVCYERAVTIDPQIGKAWGNKGNA